MKFRSCGFPLLLSVGLGCSASDADSGSAAADSSSGTDTSGADASANEGDGGDDEPAVDGTTGDDTTGGATAGDATSGNETTGDATANDETAGDTTTGDDETTTGERVTCDGPRVCVGNVPAGWNGPVALKQLGDREIPDCGGDDYTQLQVDNAYTGLTGEPATCECDCVGDGLECGGSARIRLSSALASGSLCLNPGSLFQGTVSAGVPEVFGGDNTVIWSPEFPGTPHRATIDQVDITPEGQCTPDTTGSSTAPAAVWANRTIACGTFDVEGGCDEGESCVPTPTGALDDGVCVWATGDLECPAAYPEHQLFHQEFSDTRDCSDCMCGDVAGECDGARGVIRMNVNGALPQERYVTAPSATCAEVPSCVLVQLGPPFCPDTTTLHSLELDPGDLELTDADAPCPPSGGQPEGALAVADPLTICCTAT